MSLISLSVIIFTAIVGWGFKTDLIRRYGGEDIIINSITDPLNIARISLSILAFIGFVTRLRWGRIVGILACGIWLTKFPIWTLFGIWGLLVLIPGANLFGPNRILAKDLKAEVKWRKQNKIA